MNATEIKRSDKLIALGLALCATVAMAMAVAAPANAGTYSNGFKLSKFKVEIKGWQKMVQQYHHQSENECDPDNFTSGSEKVTFATQKPIYLIASYMKGQDNPSFFATKQVAIPTKAVVKRSYTPRITLPGPMLGCEDNGGGVETTYEPDCGSKTVMPYEVQLQYSERKKDGLLLSGYSDGDPFERCPGGGGFMSFPSLLVEKASNKFIYADLSQDELFDPKFQKWISIAEGTRKDRSADHWIKTTVRWEVSFTRLKEKVSSR